LLATGCGGAGEDDKAKYLAQADRICADVAKRLDALGTPTTPGEFPAFADKAVPVIRDGRVSDPPR
jgi:hypothetical protein